MNQKTLTAYYFLTVNIHNLQQLSGKLPYNKPIYKTILNNKSTIHLKQPIIYEKSSGHVA